MSDDRYNIIESLGKGRTGEVYKAHDEKLQLQVALRKFLDANGVVDFTEHEREFGEIAQFLCNLQHQNLLKIYDAGITQGEAYIVSQLLNGESLQEEIKKGPLHFTAAGQLARQMLDAFTLIHDQGFYHGALTPNSILMTPRARGGYRYIIIDMGLPQLATLIQNKDSALTLVGDPVIYAPELLDGGEADEQSDLYMLGQILYMCLAGHHPYGDVSNEEVKELHLNGLPPIDEFNQEVPAELSEWLKKLIAINRDERFGSSVEALQSLPQIASPVFVPKEQPQEPVRPETTTIQPNPIKRNTAPVPARTATAPVPITAPVAITAPEGVTPVTAPVPVMAPGPNTATVAVYETSGNATQIVVGQTANVTVQEEKKKKPLGLLIGLGFAVIAIIATTLVMLNSKDKTTSSELITYYDGSSGQNKGWKFRSPVNQSLHPNGQSWLIDDNNGKTFPGVRFPLAASASMMFERGWRLTYKVSALVGSHRIGFQLSNENNPGWLGGGDIGCCVVIKFEEGKIHFYSPQNASYKMSYDKLHSIAASSQNRKFSVITIEQTPKNESGEYTVKLDGKEIYRDFFTKNVQYGEHEVWINNLFSSALDRKSQPSWSIKSISLETLE